MTNSTNKSKYHRGFILLCSYGLRAEHSVLCWSKVLGWANSIDLDIGGVLARRASFFDHSPLVPLFALTSPNNLEYLLAVSKNLAHPLHPVYDDGIGGGWQWWG